MFDKLKTLAHDKALHVIGGSLVGAVASGGVGIVGSALWQSLASVGAAAVAGFAVERMQSRANKKAIAAGQPAPHAVEKKDILATAIGGLIVAVPGAPSLLALLR